MGNFKLALARLFASDQVQTVKGLLAKVCEYVVTMGQSSKLDVYVAGCIVAAGFGAGPAVC